MQPTRIAELLEPFLGQANDQRLTANDLQNISIYIDLLLRWNARINLTAIRQPEEIVTRHFGESLFAARHLFPRVARTLLSAKEVAADVPVRPSEPGTAIRLIDIGSGAGFPGLPIKIWAPQIHLTMIESNQKKATFLREVIRAITLTHVNVFSARAEDYPPNQADIVTLRAVEQFQSALPSAIRLLNPLGRIALMIGESQIPQTITMTKDFLWHPPIQIPISANRVVLIGTRNQDQQVATE